MTEITINVTEQGSTVTTADDVADVEITTERQRPDGKMLTLDAQQNLIYDKFEIQNTMEGQNSPWVWDVYDDFIVAKVGGSYYRVSYTVDDEEAVTFAPREEWEEVRLDREWVPVTKSLPESNALKAIGKTDDEMRVANYMVLFGGRDLTGQVYGENPNGTNGEYFTGLTKFDSSYTKTGVLYVDWEHGRGGDGEPQRDDLLGVVDWNSAKADETGLWVERVLERRNQYMEFLEPLIEAGLVGNSTEAVGKDIERDEDGNILAWPLKRDTLTVTPMEPRMLLSNQVALRAIQGLSEYAPALKALLPEDAEASEQAGDTVTTEVHIEESTESGKSTATTTANEDSPEDKIMTDNTQPEAQPAMFSEETLKSAVDAALAQFAEKAKPAGDEVVIVEDEADKKAKAPWKSFGDFLIAVKHAGSPGMAVDPRLRTKATGLSEGVPADGGFLVQTDYASELLKRTYEMGEITSRVRNYPISANSNGLTINAINETSRVDGSRWGGILAYWLSEAGTKTASKPEFRQMELKLKKLIGLCYATDELLQDSTALGSILSDGFSEEFSFKVEDAIVNGTGAGQPLGLMNSGALVTVPKEVGQAATTIVFENIVKMWARMWGRSRQNAVWLINQDIEPQLYGLNLAVGTGGQTVYLPPGGLSAVPYGTLFGRPVLPVEYTQTLGTAGDIILADFNQYLMINKGGMETATSIHVNFVYDETAFRFVLRTDGQPGWNAPLTPYKGTNTQSPFVVLATRS